VKEVKGSSNYHKEAQLIQFVKEGPLILGY